MTGTTQRLDERRSLCRYVSSAWYKFVLECNQLLLTEVEIESLKEPRKLTRLKATE
jgi:hypothetical protein